MPTEHVGVFEPIQIKLDAEQVATLVEAEILETVGESPRELEGYSYQFIVRQTIAALDRLGLIVR